MSTILPPVPSPDLAPAHGSRRLARRLLSIRQSAGTFSALRWAAVLLPVVIFLAAAGWTWRTNQNDVEDRLTRTVDMLHEHASRSFDTQIATIEAVDQRVGGMSWEAIATSFDVHNFLAAMARSAAPSGGMLLVNPDGLGVNGSARFPATLDTSMRDYFQVHRASDAGIHLGAIVRARPQNYNVFTISRRRYRGPAAPAFDGVIVASFKPDYFEEFYRSVAETKRDVIALVREDGAILARTPISPEPDTPEARQRLSLLTQARRDGRAFASARSSLDGITRTYAVRRIENYPAYVAYGLDNSAIVRRWAADVAAYALICAGAGLMLSLLTRQTQLSVKSERAALAAAHSEAERRAEAEARLRHSQRIDALGRMVGGVAHDFRNIVMAVTAGSRSIARHASEPTEVRRLADMVEKAAERGARLTSRMVAFARSDENRTSSTDVEPSLESVAELLSHTLGPGYRVETRVERGLPAIRGDETEFETVIINLVLNARDAMPRGGTVTIFARAIAEADAPQHVEIRVVDSGEGMDEATLARAGEAFFTTKPPGQGTGLGLAMARSFAEQSGGSLTIASKPGEGTTITVVLGLHQPDEASEPVV